MERRDFVRALVAGGALGASTWAAHGRAGNPSPAGPPDVTIVIQRGASSASEIADAIGLALADCGLGHATITSAARWRFPEIAALLDRPRGSWLIGVAQDAAAEICQAAAATQGSACVLHAHHRIGHHDVRHSCSSPSVGEAVVWTEHRSARSVAIGRLYAAALGAALQPGHDAFADPPALLRAADTASTSLASFLIRI